jgi:signal peptidase I
VPGDHVKGTIEEGKPVVYVNGVRLDEPYVNTYPLMDLWKGNIPTEQDFYNGTVCEDIRSFDPAKSFAEQTLYTLDPALRITAQQVNVSFLTQRGFVYDATLDAYVLPADKPLANGGDVFDVVLGSHEYWVMGDNRKGSDDSRRWGPLREELIHGVIEWRFFSLQYTKPWSFWYFDESWALCDLLLHPFSFFKRVRWDRCFGSMHYTASS